VHPGDDEAEALATTGEDVAERFSCATHGVKIFKGQRCASNLV
jgi:hypothetical protein